MIESKFKEDYFGEKQKVSEIDYCQFCWDMATTENKKKEPIFACVSFGQSGWNSPCTVCRWCLMAIANQEIENIRTGMYELGIKLPIFSDYIGVQTEMEKRINAEKDLIYALAYMGLE